MSRTANSTSVVERNEPADLVYQMKITLRGIRPQIWRRIQVTGDTLLWALHGVLQTVMGWNDEHPHRFLINGIYYGEPGLSSSALVVVDEESVRLDQVIALESERFTYEYGSGTGWDHEILIEKILPRRDGERYPTCHQGERACPPEHSGSPWGYRKFLKGLNSSDSAPGKGPKDIGKDFDPEGFVAAEVNRRLGWP
jgi:hypothetical protein